MTWSWVAAAKTCQCGSVPRGPRYRGVAGPCEYSPNVQIDAKMIIHANREVATTRYPIRSPRTAEAIRYGVPTNSTTALTTTRTPLAKLGVAARRARTDVMA